MSLMDVSPVVSYRLYQTALSNAEIALDVMRSLPPSLDPTRELALALERVIAAIKAGSLGVDLISAVDLLDAIAAGGQS